MSKEIKRKAQPFDSFASVFKALHWLGFYKLLTKPKGKCQIICHRLYTYVYRPFAFLLIVLYNVQHIIFLFQVSDMKVFFSALKMEVVHMNIIVKFLTINLGKARLDKLQEVMNGHFFTANSKGDETYLAENTKEMYRLTRNININLCLIAVVWFLMPLAVRLQDGYSVIPTYIPFETDTWKGLVLGSLMESGPIPWIGFGHLAIDCLIATYFAQATVQLKIIKHNLEHLFDDDENNLFETRMFQYRDVADKTINERFIYYVKRYDKVIWFTKEVTSIFNIAITIQLCTTNASIGLVIYEMSTTDMMSMSFAFYLGFYVTIQSQGYLYCYYGNLLKYESDMVANSLYMSDWLSLSPRFRRQMIIAMLQWSRPIAPRVMKNVPLALDTFISITRLSYSLFTVLKTT